MNARTKGLERLERSMESLDQGSLRYKVLETAKRFKTSWIDLAQILFTVWQDKHYKEWGYMEFDTYVNKEIGVKKDTAMKLLRSYSFLEKEEPKYISPEYRSDPESKPAPNYESVYVLRGAKNKREVGSEDYQRLKEKVFDKGSEAKDIKRDLTQIIKERRQEDDPEEAQRKRKIMVVRRLTGTLKSLKRECQTLRVLPESAIEMIDEVIDVLDRSGEAGE